MSDAFFSIPELLQDRKFVPSLLLSTLVAAGAVGGGIYALSSQKITVDPIVKVAVVQAPPPASIVKPISQIRLEYDAGYDTGYDTGVPSKSVWEAYIVNLKTICAMKEAQEHYRPALILSTSTSSDAFVGKVNIDARTCNLLKKFKGNEDIFIATDKKPDNLPSEKRYLAPIE